jgi:HNH endonuclease
VGLHKGQTPGNIEQFTERGKVSRFKCGPDHPMWKGGITKIRRANQRPRPVHPENYLVDCACGCGKKLMRFDSRNRERSYMSGHNPVVGFTGRRAWNKGLRGYKAASQHYNWKGGVTAQTRIDRQRFAKTVSPKVLKRDDYTCQLCGVRGGYLHVDHIKAWALYPKLRFVLSNCRTLCVSCHYKVTFNKEMPKGRRWAMTPVGG